MSYLITKEDFTADLVDFSVHTHDHKIYPHISEAVRFNLFNALSAGLCNALLTLSGTSCKEWNIENIYQAGKYAFTGSVLGNGKVWKALANNLNSVPTELNLNWAEDDLYTFFHFYVKPYLVLSAYIKYLGVGNMEMTPTGLRQFREDESTVVDFARSDYYRQEYEKRLSHYRNAMLAQFKAKNYTVAGVTYIVAKDTSCNPKTSGIRLRAV